jgi:transposase
VFAPPRRFSVSPPAGPNRPAAKPPRQRLRRRARRGIEGLERINLNAAGIDVGSKQNYICVPAHAVKPGEPTVRVFGVFTPDMDAAVEWLLACGVTTAAMEATGVYWFTLYAKLEARGIEVVLVEPSSVKQVPGRKSDVLDCQWLQRLHTYGLLRGSFRPDAPTRRLRALARQRLDLVQAGVAHLQQMQKAMVEMNVQLHLVVSDINGETGLRIIEAILQGERDPEALVKLRDPRCRKSTRGQMKAALAGDYREEELFVLRQNLESWKHYQAQLQACDQQLEAALAAYPTARTDNVPPLPAKPAAQAAEPGAKKAKKQMGGGANGLTLDVKRVAEELRRICGVALAEVNGLNLLSVLMLIAEIGVDMSRWPNAKAFCSWLGLCPGSKISGGRVLSRRTRKVVNRAAVILRMAALGTSRSESWVGRFYRRKKAHLGAPKAITATARKLACVVYHMLKYRDEYRPLDLTAYELQAQTHRLRRLRREAKEMGMQVIELQKAA